MAFDTNHNDRFVELLAIGNELLVGQVQDTNSHWLVQQLTGLGAQVRRASMVRDDYDDIGTELRAALERGPKLVITTGGLGPTDDDMTFRAIARAFELPLEVHPEALEMVRRRYEYLATVREGFDPSLNDARRKMAHFPRGADVLANATGAAPALALDLGSTTLVSLPGVPSEMKDIFSTSLQPILARTLGTGCYVERNLFLDRGDESQIAALLAQVQARHTTVYIKSRGQARDGVRHLTVVLARGGNDLAEVRGEVLGTEAEIVAGLATLGYGIVEVIESGRSG
ncbi:MAG: molybdopterin-binding protein [Acidimicrobiales bacterium]